MIVKFNYDFFALEGGQHIQTKADLILSLEKFLMKADILNNKYYYPVAQHLISNLMANFNFPSEILSKITGITVDYSSYNGINVKANSIIEAYVFKKALYDFIIENKNINVMAQNPDDSSGTIQLYASEAYKLTKQPYPDYCVEINDKVCRCRSFRLDIIYDFHLYTDNNI